ncbi:hypothetical protein [uncultured Nostoc sp.]|uniref:hypothetical protein n=1 Tax=uncultured Nostoc sp. TaxID=340711 RepID=UPI0035CB528D
MKKHSLIALILISVLSGLANAASLQARPKLIAGTKPQVHQVSSQKVETIKGLPVKRLPGSIIPIDGLDDLIAKSDLIVIGKTDKSVAEARSIIGRDREGFIATAVSEVPFKVSKVFKGDLTLKEISLGQQAAVVPENWKSYIRVFDEYTPLEPGKKYVLFLRKGIATGEGLYFPTGVMYGKYNVDGGDAREDAAFDDPTFKAIKKVVKDRFKE